MIRLLLLLLGMLAGSPLVLTGAVPPGGPPRPAPLRAVAVSASQIRLSWPSRFTSEGDFRIERSADAEHFVQVALIPAATKHYTDEGLISATTYYYRVSSHTAAGDSPYSNVAHTQTRGPKGHLSLTSWGHSVGDPPAKLDDLVAVSAGLNQQVALQKSGKVTVWGDENSTNGQIKFPKGLTHVTAIAAGGFHGLALKSNGEVVAWGSNTNQQSVPPVLLKKVVAIAAGQNHSLALKADGTVVGWGDNSQGQCSPPTNLNHVVAIAAGGNHSLALKSNGTVVAWGEYLFRWQQSDWTNIVAIAAGVNHDLLLRRDGTVVVWISPWAWWWSSFPPFELTNVVAIAAGDTHNLALEADGSVVGWGYYQSGAASVPEGLSKVAFIAAGANVSLALSILPAPPLQFTARAATTNQVTFSWVDNCNDEDSYIIERATNVDFWDPGEWRQIATLRANTTHYTDNTALSGFIYSYRVRAHNRWGLSAVTTASTQSLGMVSPPTPNNLYVSIGITNCVNLSWMNYVWFTGPPDGYEVQRSRDIAGSPGAWFDIGSFRDRHTGRIDFTDTNAASLQSYSYRIRAYNVFGVSEYTAAANIVLTPPPAPDLLTVNAFADRMVLNWYINDPFGSGMDAFAIERAPDIAGSPGIWGALATMPIREPYSWSYTYSDAGHDLSTTWWYRVRTHSWVGYGPYSTPTNATIVLPAAPGSLAGWLGGSNQVSLSWYQAPSDQNGFRIERAPDADGLPGPWTEIGVLLHTNLPDGFFTDRQVTALTTNWYRVRAFNQLGNSDYSSVIAVAAVPPPQPSLSVSAFRDQFNLNYSLSGYRFATDNFSGYKIERAPDAGGSPGTWMQIAQTFEESFTDSGHALDTTCWYRVRASNWAGDSVYSPAVSSTILPPGGPEGLTARIGTTNQINLSWSDSHYDQDGFVLERASDAGSAPGSWTEIAVISATNAYEGNFTDTNVTAYTTNWYRVRAFNGVGLSTFDGPVSVAVTPPPAPNYSGASVDRNQVHFWVIGNYVNYADYGKVAGFKIERALDNNGNPGAWEEIGESSLNEYGYLTFYTDMRSFVNTTWWYRARAFNWIGESDPGPVASANIIPPAAPEPIYGKIGVSNQIDLTWNQPWNQFDEDGFRLERASDISGAPGIWTEIAVIPATNAYSGFYSDTNVIPHSTNWYRVRAFNVVGNSDYGPSNTMAAIPPEPPHSLSAAPSRGQVNLRWESDYYVNYGFVAGFKIERAPDIDGIPGGWRQIGTVALTNPYAGSFAFQDSGRELSSTWWYRVRAVNWTGDSEASVPAKATIVLPAAPSWLTGWVDPTNGIMLAWQQGNNDQDGFRLERASETDGLPGAWSEIAIIAATNANYGNFTDTNVTALTTNWYRIRAFNALGDSDYAEPVRIEAVPPPAPNYASAYAYRDRIDVSWGGNYWPYVGFKIERAPDIAGQPGTWLPLAQVETDNYNHNFSDTNLMLGSTWWYRIRAFNWTGDSEPSPLASATILPPATPDSLTGRIGGTNEVLLGWSQPINDQDGFRLEKASDAGGLPGTWQEIGVLSASNSYAASFTDTNATALSTNWYRVRAYNLFGNSDYSEPALVEVVPPPPPYYMYAQPYRDRMNLTWYADYDEYGTNNGFKIERAPDIGGEPGVWIQVGQVGENSGSYSDSNLVLNATWWYRVRAYNWIGDGEPSQETYATILPPAAPDWIVGRIGATNQVKLFWHDSSVDADGFRLERATDDNGIPGTWGEIALIAVTNASDIEFSDTNATALATYWYRVQAFNSLGESDYTVSAAMPVLPPPMPYLSANVFRDQVNLYGYLPYMYNYGQVDGFQLERAPDEAGAPGAWSQITTKTLVDPYDNYLNYTDPARPVNLKFWYRLRAFNWVGEGDYSPGVSAMTVPPATPNYIYGTLGSTNEIKLTWYDYAEDEDGFQLERAPDTNGIPGAWEEIANIHAPNAYAANYTDTNVTAYTTNWYRVRAYSVLGASGYCAAIRVKAVPPDAPTLINTLYYGPANLYWSPNEPAQGSELERATNSTAGPAAWASVRRYDIVCAGYYDDTNIVAGGSYAYRAKSFNWVGDSPWSSVVVINIAALTPSLAGVSASTSTPALHITSLILTNQNVFISWDALGGTTNVVEATANLAGGFADISGPLTITGSGIVATNFLDSGVLTNANRRFYRIKVP